MSWSSDNTLVATVSGGTVTAAKPGSATITVTTKAGGKTARCSVTVKPRITEVRSIRLTDSEGQARGKSMVGETFTLQVAIDPADATDRSLTWEATTDRGKVDDQGKVTALKPGDCVIRATAVNGVFGEYYLEIDPVLVQGIVVKDPEGRTEGSVMMGRSVQLTASVTPVNATHTPVWSSSKESVATVDQDGLVKSAGAGSATITATVDGKSASYSLTVSFIKVTSVEVTPPSLTITAGQTRRLQATVSPESASIQALKWISSNDKAATVDQDGLLTALSAGRTRIYATAIDGSGISGTCEVTVEADQSLKGITLSPTQMELKTGESKDLIVLYDPENAADKGVSWISDSPSVATVSEGRVTGVAEGTAKITATSAEGGFTATCTVHVTSSLPQGTKVFFMTGADHNLFLNGDPLCERVFNFALAGQDVYYTGDHFLYKYKLHNNEKQEIKRIVGSDVVGLSVAGTHAYCLVSSQKSMWLVTVDLTTGESRRTDFIEEQSVNNFHMDDVQMTVSEDGTVHALTRVTDAYGETSVCLYRITLDGNHTRTLVCKALDKVDGNGNSVTGVSRAAPIGIAINDAGDLYYMVYKQVTKNHNTTDTGHLYKNGTEIRVYEDFWLNYGRGLSVKGDDVYAWYALFSPYTYRSIIMKNGSVLYEFDESAVRGVQADDKGDLYYLVNKYTTTTYRGSVYRNNDLLYSVDKYATDLQLME